MEFAEYGNLNESRYNHSIEKLCRYTIQTAAALEHIESRGASHVAFTFSSCLVVSKNEVSYTDTAAVDVVSYVLSLDTSLACFVFPSAGLVTFVR